MLPFSILQRGQTRSSPESLQKKSTLEKNIDFQEKHKPNFPIKHLESFGGRNYKKSLKPAEQFLPCDDEEMERLQVNLLLFKMFFLTDHSSPVKESLKKGIKVLNVASGPGWWTIDMAKEYPLSHFTGLDVIFYPVSIPPPNCHFRVVPDLTKRLPYEDGTFDYVFQYDALFRYSVKDWKAVIPELVRVCKPGGFIELFELAGAVQDIGPNMSIWMMRLAVSLQTRGINMKYASSLQNILEQVGGLEDIEANFRSAPIGWYGKNGDIMLESLGRLFDSVKPRLCEDWSMESAKYDKVVKAAAAECREFRSWLNHHSLLARKKMNAPQNLNNTCKELNTSEKE